MHGPASKKLGRASFDATDHSSRTRAELRYNLKQQRLNKPGGMKMFVESRYMRNYLFTALQGSLELYDHLLEGLTESEADLRPDPDRFTIREIMAHLADWEAIFLQRMLRMRDEDHPTIEGLDEGQRAIDASYASTDWRDQTRLFRERREATVAFLNSLPGETWKRTALRPEIGEITIEAQALLMTLHDSYHLQQVKQWRHS